MRSCNNPSAATCVYGPCTQAQHSGTRHNTNMLMVFLGFVAITIFLVQYISDGHSYLNNHSNISICLYHIRLFS